MRIIILLTFVFLLPWPVLAGQEKTDRVFKAEVLEVIKEKSKEIAAGEKIKQQNIRLEGLSGEYKGEEVVFEGISKAVLAGNKIYEKGDKVMVVASYDNEGQVSFYITDHIRTGALFWLFLVFAAVLLAVGKNKGLRAIISLTITFLIIVKFIVPAALSGAPLVWPALFGSVAILAAIVYFTEGLNKRSHIAVASTAISLLAAVAISWAAVEAAKLSGLGSEEISHLISIGSGSINFKGLLLSGMIIGSLGVMDDVIISQVAAVQQIYETDKSQSRTDIFRKAMDIGVSHISSMTNTLFLAYAGASLPLLVLFVSGESAFSSWLDVINNESVASEIVRALAGSIGLILSVPISTYLAVWIFKSRRKT